MSIYDNQTFYLSKSKFKQLSIISDIKQYYPIYSNEYIRIRLLKELVKKNKLSLKYFNELEQICQDLYSTINILKTKNIKIYHIINNININFRNNLMTMILYLNTNELTEVYKYLYNNSNNKPICLNKQYYLNLNKNINNLTRREYSDVLKFLNLIILK